MRGFIKFNKGIMKTPLPVRLWLMVLVVANLAVPLFYLNHLEAQVILISILASMVLMSILTARTGFTRLLGLGHIFWIPLLYFLWTRLCQIPANDFFGIWVRAVMVLNAVSLVADASDVIRYAAGDRTETVTGLEEEER